MFLKPSPEETFYEHDVEPIFQSQILSEKDYKSSLGIARDAVDTLRAKGKKGTLEMLEAVSWRDDISNFNAIGTFYRRFHSVLVIGMGGASLGGKALCSLFQSWVMSDSSFPFTYFLDNLDPEVFWELMSDFNPKTTGVLVISKSGETAETLMLLMRCLEYWKDLLTPYEISTNFTAVTAPKSALARIAEKHQFSMIPHPPHIGGRFSCFTVTGLLPLIMVGGDPRKVRQGGALTLKNFFAQKHSLPLKSASVLHALYDKVGITNHVLMPYGDAFAPFAQWARQLIAESLGKDGKGLTPITALGPCDQHSQLQLYLDGPKDKCFTLFSERNRPREKLKPEMWQSLPELDFLADATLDDLLSAEQRATAHVLAKNGCAVRSFRVKTFNELSMGALMAHFMIETLLLGELLGVDPLTQPAVDSVKVLAKRFLTEPTQNVRHAS